MNYLDAAFRVLSRADEPLQYAEIAERAIAGGLIAPEGKTPDATMGSRLYVDTKKEGSRFKRASKGYFTLAERERSDEITDQVQRLNRRTRARLRRLLRDMPAEKFETLVGELLIALGFDETTVEVTDFSGDGGVDVRGVLQAGGITSVNAAVQVKKWQGNVPVGTVRNVRGALTSHEQGIIITTSDFTRGAQTEAAAVGKAPISLVNGDDLLELLIDHGIGVEKESHTVLALDDEYWAEFVETEPEPEPAAEPAALVTFPLIVRASNDHEINARLLNQEGHMVFRGQTYTSPSPAGRDASGWQACNGWRYWQYEDRKSGEWRLIDELRPKEP